MNYTNAFFGLCCFSGIAMHAMYKTTSHDGIVELQKLLKFNRASNCNKRHRVSYDEWIKRQNKQTREINNAEIGPLVDTLGFSELPTRTSEVDKRIYEILSKPLFCDQIYKNHEGQEIIRALARDIIIAGEILKGAITNSARNVPVLTQDSFLFSPLSTVIAALVSYITNNVPDISSDDINRVQELISQLLRQAGKEPSAKEMRIKADQDLSKYLRQTAPLLYEDIMGKGVNRIPTQKEYQYATQILSQNKPFAIPKSINGAIEAWRIRASEFLQSTDYQPERYNDPEIAHLVKSMVEDINSAAAIIKAYLQKKPTQAIIKKSSLVDPAVHDRIKEIIKSIALPVEQTNVIDMLTEQKFKIEQLPAEYQQALKQYFNIDERIQKIRPVEVAQPTAESVTEPKPEPAAIPEQAIPAPVSLAPVEPISTKPEEPKPAEPSVPAAPVPAEIPAPAEEIKPIGLTTTTPEKSAAATGTTASAAPSDQPAPATTTQVQPTTLEGTAIPTGTSLREALEKQGQIREIAVGGRAVPSGPVAPASSTTPSTPAARSSTPAASSSVSQSVSAETPVVSPVVETPQQTVPEVTPEAAETPSIPSTPSVSYAPAQQPVNLPTVQSVQQSGREVRNSLEELRDQLKRLNVAA